MQWNAKWQSAVVCTDNFWQAEIAIPFEELGVSAPQEATSWGINICRNRVQKNETVERFSWSPLVEVINYKQPRDFGLLRFVGEEAVVQIDQVGDLFPGKQHLVAKLVGTSKVKIDIASGNIYDLNLRQSKK